MIALKRIYEPAEDADDFRILVERLWPRGTKKENARVALWLKEISPSPELRKWYAHEPEKWPEFQRRYRAELEANPAVVELRQILRQHPQVTFVYAARDEERNSARLLKEYMEEERD